ncbi:beta-lactamase superfamily domain-containing protein [Nitrosomonas sp. PY1]|uniref:MBL fold metallo-hydrolase n=1 Tax=Nitrosomonas sp. PY1 TaxID=1803906 RepID=UPI001FC7F39A|nr:3',5'-cyclic-nucleotide phosphodiesterase [Nitrosomonas sp. PY1]GKS68854.1 beta-lactamase superfamily domain-containing protein [Nitrosomonas sp. PY1]
MKLRTLGCSGGIGSGEQTTAFLLDEDILIDAGTGVGGLRRDEMIKIDHIFLTHAHLDHVVFVPFLVDTVGYVRDKPVTVYVTKATHDVLQKHLFNWHLWPDFTKIPNQHTPYMRYQILTIGDTIDLQGRKITPLPANHVVPTVGYQLNSGRSSLVFTSDTTTNPEFWPIINKIQNLKYLIIESAFCNQKRNIAIRSKHYCPSLLIEDLKRFERHAEIYITHLKPGEADITMDEIRKSMPQLNPRKLENNQTFEF